MKFLIAISLFFLSEKVSSQTKSAPRVLIKYVHPGIHTIVAIDYREFDTAFVKSMYKDTVFDNTYLLQKLKKEYAKARYRNNYKRIDTRYKISLFYPDKMEPILVYMSYYGEASINHRLLSQCDFLKSLNGLIDSLTKKDKQQVQDKRN